MYEDYIAQLDRVEVPQTHTLTARYGLNLYDVESMWLFDHGTEEEKRAYATKRTNEFNDRVEKEIGTKLSNLAGRERKH